MKITSILFASLLVSGAAFAEEAATTTTATTATKGTFDNHLNSTLMVSPAQLYQVEALRNDLQLGFTNNWTESKADGAKNTGKSTATDLNVGAIYNVQGAGARVGLTLDYGTWKSESKTTGADTVKGPDATMMKVSPVGAYTIADMVVVGAAVNVLQTSVKASGAKEVKFTHTTVQPGVLFKNNQLEAGLTMEGESKATTKIEGVELESYNPGWMTVHGRYAINNAMAAGGIITNTGVTKNTKDTSKAVTDVTGTFEYGMDAVKVEGTLGMTTAGYKKKENMDSSNVATMQVGGAADYTINAATVVGGGLTYAWGSEKNAGVTHAANDLGVALRGKMTF